MSTARRRITPTGVVVLPASAPHADWLRARTFDDEVGYCIGSSDVPPIMGVPFTQPARAVWLDKRGEGKDRESEAMYWGKRLEATIADDWARRNRSVIRDIGIVANVDFPWRRASIDRMVMECPLDRQSRQRCALEVKCRNAFGSKRWHAEVPDDILAQTTWQMLVAGYDHVHVAALIGGNDFRQSVVRWDDTVAAYIADTVTDWRAKYLVDGVEPPFEEEKAPAHLELDRLLYGDDRAGSREIDMDGIAEVMEYARLAALRGLYNRLTERQKAKLHELAGGHRFVTFANELAYDMEPRPGRPKVDLDLLAERFPDAYAACVEQTTSLYLNLAKAYKVPSLKEEPSGEATVQ